MSETLSISDQIIQLAQEHRIALEVISGSKELLGEYKRKLKDLEGV